MFGIEKSETRALGSGATQTAQMTSGYLVLAAYDWKCMAPISFESRERGRWGPFKRFVY